MGLGHAYEIDPWLEDSFLLEIAQAQLIRQIFDRHPIKWMPPTKHKTGDIFFAHVHDAMFDLVGITTNQSIELLGMFSEAIQNPLLMDRYLALKATRYVYGAARHLGEEIEFKPDGRVARRADAGARRGARAARGGPARFDLGGHRARRLRRREADAHGRQGVRRRARALEGLREPAARSALEGADGKPGGSGRVSRGEMELLVWAGVAFAVSLLASWAAAWVALAPLRATAPATWVDRARLGFPARAVSRFALLLLPVSFAVFAELAGGVPAMHPAVVVASTAAPSLAATFLVRLHVERVLRARPVGAGEMLRGWVGLWTVMYPHLVIAMVGAALVTDALDVRSCAAIAMTALAVAAAMAGGGVALARLLGLARPASERLKRAVDAASAATGVRARAVMEVDLMMANAFALPATGLLLFTPEAVRTLKDAEIEADREARAGARERAEGGRAGEGRERGGGDRGARGGAAALGGADARPGARAASRGGARAAGGRALRASGGAAAHAPHGGEGRRDRAAARGARRRLRAGAGGGVRREPGPGRDERGRRAPAPVRPDGRGRGTARMGTAGAAVAAETEGGDGGVHRGDRGRGDGGDAGGGDRAAVLSAGVGARAGARAGAGAGVGAGVGVGVGVGVGLGVGVGARA